MIEQIKLREATPSLHVGHSNSVLVDDTLVLIVHTDLGKELGAELLEKEENGKSYWN